MESCQIAFYSPFSLKNRQTELLCSQLAKVKSAVLISKDGCYRICNAKSPVGVLSLNINKADHVLVRIEGPDCVSDVLAVKNIFQSALS